MVFDTVFIEGSSYSRVAKTPQLSHLLDLPTNLVGRIFNSLPLIHSKIPGIKRIYIQHSELELKIALVLRILAHIQNVT